MSTVTPCREADPLAALDKFRAGFYRCLSARADVRSRPNGFSTTTRASVRQFASCSRVTTVANIAGGYLGARVAMARGSRFVRAFFLVVVTGFVVRIGGDLLGWW